LTGGELPRPGGRGAEAFHIIGSAGAAVSPNFAF
jgi:hypothetical protein